MKTSLATKTLNFSLRWFLYVPCRLRKTKKAVGKRNLNDYVQIFLGTLQISKIFSTLLLISLFFGSFADYNETRKIRERKPKLTLDLYCRRIHLHHFHRLNVAGKKTKHSNSAHQLTVEKSRYNNNDPNRHNRTLKFSAVGEKFFSYSVIQRCDLFEEKVQQMDVET